jgi:hypothetical protein
MATNTNTRADEITHVAEQGHPNGKPRREKAAEFLTSHGEDQSSFTFDEEKAVVKRIDRRVLVLILGAYFLQQLDKSSLRFAGSPARLQLAPS